VELTTFLKIVSVGASIWAIRYYWKTQPPLDRRAIAVRWGGILLCIVWWFVVVSFLRSIPHGGLWIREHPATFVLLAGPPSFLCGALVLLPEFSRRIASAINRSATN
jgi:hypothetical protein